MYVGTLNIFKCTYVRILELMKRRIRFVRLQSGKRSDEKPWPPVERYDI
jgi:hypothetical protein